MPAFLRTSGDANGASAHDPRDLPRNGTGCTGGCGDYDGLARVGASKLGNTNISGERGQSQQAQPLGQWRTRRIDETGIARLDSKVALPTEVHEDMIAHAVPLALGANNHSNTC